MKTARLLTTLIALSTLIFSGEAFAGSNPVSGVSMMTALRDAHAIAANRSDLKVLRVEGNSMLPFFGPGAVLIVKNIPAEKLRAGMVVVYTNRYNETVAHGLVNETSEGWTARGYNNNEADSTPVNGANLMGVVYATFHSDALPADPMMVSALASATPVAMAAAAR